MLLIEKRSLSKARGVFRRVTKKTLVETTVTLFQPAYFFGARPSTSTFSAQVLSSLILWRSCAAAYPTIMASPDPGLVLLTCTDIFPSRRAIQKRPSQCFSASGKRKQQT
jgi:hypothetical protein